MNTTTEQLLENMRKIRENKGLSQDYVAQKMGRGQPSYSHIERGERDLKYEDLLQFAIALDISVIDIITYPDVYVPATSTTNNTRVIVEIDVNQDEFIKMGLKDKVIQVLEK